MNKGFDAVKAFIFSALKGSILLRGAGAKIIDQKAGLKAGGWEAGMNRNGRAL